MNLEKYQKDIEFLKGLDQENILLINCLGSIYPVASLERNKEYNDDSDIEMHENYLLVDEDWEDYFEERQESYVVNTNIKQGEGK